MRAQTARVAGALASCALVLGLASCAAEPAEGETPNADAKTISIWAHAGTTAEQRVLRQQVSDYNAENRGAEAKLRLIPEGDYAAEVQTALSLDKLPDVLEVDGPRAAGLVYQGVLQPLKGVVSEKVLDAQLPSLQAQGTIGGKRYTVGAFDSGLGIYADKRALSRAGITWPTSPGDAWTAEQFTAALRVLAKRDADGKVLDVKANYGVGEWLTYGFSPLVASAGGELIDRTDRTASGIFNSPLVVAALDVIRSWAPYIDPNADDSAFIDRRVALSWVGHWVYRDYAAALGDDLLVLPLPDLGNGTKTGQGSWSWGVTTTSPSAAKGQTGKVLDYLLDDKQILQMTDANAAVPGSTRALKSSPLYGAGRPLRLLADQLLNSCEGRAPDRTCIAVPRPETPGYGTVTERFASAVETALRGGDHQQALDDGAEAIDRDLQANNSFR